jgi:hypothetical protein
VRVKQAKPKRVLVLGAGASRSVSYSAEARYRSPLNTDFLDLLQQRLAGAREKEIKDAITSVLNRLWGMSFDYWRSMERAFYTLHLRAYLADKLGSKLEHDSSTKVIDDFAISIQALLRLAHQYGECEYHQRLFAPLGYGDAIITFNYDLVAERALRRRFEEQRVDFGAWLYGFKLRLGHMYGPILLKLHGSSNWKLTESVPTPYQNSWKDFDKSPGYRGHYAEGGVFPILLPFWDKRIEKNPWIKLWTRAHSKLAAATQVLIWGYSLPLTDVKAQQLFVLGLGKERTEQLSLCIVDPSEEVRLRWRALFPKARFWEYSRIDEFLVQPPKWWPVS